MSLSLTEIRSRRSMREISSLTEQSVGLVQSAQWYRNTNGTHTAAALQSFSHEVQRGRRGTEKRAETDVEEEVR